MVTAIDIQGLSKRFRFEPTHQPRRLKDALLSGWRRRPHETLHALRDVSLSITSGRMVGIIGGNGAGKSTLLRLIAGLSRPDTGDIRVNGHLAALLELGAGFHPDLSGRENMYTSAIVSGLTKQELDGGLAEQIVAFAELEEFIDNPLRTYSAGMAMRLAFAIAIHVSPDILLIDEVLAVGDLRFQQKCLERIDAFRDQGKTIILVSHDLSSIELLCDEVIWLDKGQLRAQGPAAQVVARYKAEQAGTPEQAPAELAVPIEPSTVTLTLNENRFGSQEVELISVRLLDCAGRPVDRLESGADLTVELVYSAPHPVAGPIFGVSFSRADGVVCYNTTTLADGVHIPAISGEGVVRMTINGLSLLPGSYRFDVGVYRHDWAYAYDYHWQAYPLEVWSQIGDSGLFRPAHQWSYQALAGVPAHSGEPDSLEVVEQ
jgi:lipopolysaccharide transport system ATP-binding protein